MSRWLTIEELRLIAKERGGKCLSPEYLGNTKKHVWECARGHRWEALPSQVKRGSWCPVCFGRLPNPIQFMQDVAKQRGGECLTANYVNAHQKHLWRCRLSHEWEASWSTIRKGSWCPACSAGLGERICKEAFEFMFNKKFPTTRPAWLVNEAGNQMELDGYNQHLRLAFEHQGLQHYLVDGWMVKSERQLQRRMAMDVTKKKLCETHLVNLIEVPSIPGQLSIDKVGAFIADQCAKLGYEVNPNRIRTIFSKAYRVPKSLRLLQELQEIAVAKGGVCLSTEFKHAKAKMMWRCNDGHQWEATGDNVRSGAWCPTCAGVLRKTMDDMRGLAKSLGGECMSEDYVNAHAKLQWKCAKGHTWMARPNLVRRGKWCPHCAGNARIQIEQIKQLALDRGGHCLSIEIKNSQSRLRFNCAEGHEWIASATNIRSGTWCPKCADKRKGAYARHSIEDMQALVKSRGGECLSEEYLNSQSKLQWKCAKGHTWWAIPSNIRRGKWCPHCAGNARIQIEQIKQLALDRGGHCLSTEIKHSQSRLRFKCAEGHEWIAIANNVRRGAWCPECSSRDRKTRGS